MASTSLTPLLMLGSLMLLLMLSSSASARPPLQLDDVDKCLFTCDYCYKQAKVLVACANECMAVEGMGSMSRAWIETCPFFTQPMYFDYHHV